jgi:hypothetical protein
MKIDSDVDRQRSIRQYILLIERFLRKDLSLDRFIAEYFTTFKSDQTIWSVDEYNLLNGLFIDLDCYESIPELRPAGFDGQEAIEQIPSILNSLKTIEAELAPTTTGDVG